MQPQEPESTQPQTPAPEQPTEQAGEQAQQEPEISWEVIEKALDKVPVDQLRKHKRFAGVLGGALQQAQLQWERDRKAADDQAARERMHEELRQLAQEDPIAFSEKWLGTDDAEKLRDQMHNLKASTASEYMRQIGQTFSKEFQLTEDDVAKIGEALAGKTDDEVLPTFNLVAAKIVSEREAQKRFDEWRSKELEREREALKQEVAAELMKGETPPSIRRSTPPPTVKPWQLSDKEFDKFYEEQVLKPARSWKVR
jgi:hypothetical protein